MIYGIILVLQMGVLVSSVQAESDILDEATPLEGDVDHKAHSENELGQAIKIDEGEKERYVGKMVDIPGGIFRMGDLWGSGELDEKPVHQVHIKPFKIGAYELTQSQWEAVMGSNPSTFKGNNRPVDNVSWDNIQTYIERLNKITGGRYRLPTEAEWEYAARAWSTTIYSFGNEIGNNKANCGSCGSQWDFSQTPPVSG